MIIFLVMFPTATYFINENAKGDNKYEKFKDAYNKAVPMNLWILVTLTCGLIAAQIALIMLICKNFGKQLRLEIIYLSIVQFFFQMGFAFRVYLDINTRNKLKEVPDGKVPEISGKDQFWYTILPVFYEALPILSIYLHHIKNFRFRSMPRETNAYELSEDNSVAANSEGEARVT